MAAISRMPVETFRKRFSTELGIPPLAYLQFLKMERAKTLLRGGMNVKQTGVEIGMPDPYHFSKQFKHGKEQAMNDRENYESWLRDFQNDAETAAELKAIENQPGEIEDRFYRPLSFGTAGMRGVLGAGTNRMGHTPCPTPVCGVFCCIITQP